MTITESTLDELTFHLFQKENKTNLNGIVSATIITENRLNKTYGDENNKHKSNLTWVWCLGVYEAETDLVDRLYFNKMNDANCNQPIVYCFVLFYNCLIEKDWTSFSGLRIGMKK